MPDKTIPEHHIADGAVVDAHPRLAVVPGNKVAAAFFPSERLPSWNTASLESPLSTAILACLVSALSYFAAKLGLALIVPPYRISPLWPINALLVAVLLLVPRKIWPILIAAGLAATTLADMPLDGTWSIWPMLGDLCEVLIAATGLRHFFQGPPRLNNGKALARYSLVAVILAPFIAAFVGALAGIHGSYWLNWRLWFLSDSLALLTLTPAVWGWVHLGATFTYKSRAYYLETSALYTALAFVGYFSLIAAERSSPPALLYCLVPFLLWSALRFGFMGVSTSVLVVAFLSIWGAVHGRGPFTVGPINNVLSLQLFLFCTAAPFMVLAVLVEERQQAEGAVRESEERFRLVANTAPVLIWMSGPDKLCTYFNQPWLDFTGRALSAELGNGWAESVHKDDRESCLETYHQAFDRRQPFRMEYRLRRFDGEYRWLLDIGVPRGDAGGSFAGFIGSCMDVTDRKAAEEALASVGGRLLEAQEQERSRIARELHDDINQRLALLAIELQQLKQDSPDSSSSTRGRMDGLVVRTLGIATDIQALSHRLHSSKLEYLGLVSAVTSFCKEFSGQQNVEIHVTCADVPRVLPSEISLCLFRILQEGLQNAAKHSGVKYFEVELRGSPSEVYLTLRDSGSGFEPELTLRTRGLGLISMRERTSLVKGTISITSRPGRGTEISVRVPVGESAKTLRIS